MRRFGVKYMRQSIKSATNILALLQAFKAKPGKLAFQQRSHEGLHKAPLFRGHFFGENPISIDFFPTAKMGFYDLRKIALRNLWNEALAAKM